MGSRQSAVTCLPASSRCRVFSTVRILQVANGFPPGSQGGAEVFVHDLARALQSLGHDLGVFHRVSDRSRPEHALEISEDRGLRRWSVNRTYRECKRFEDTYRDPAIDAIFGQLLDDRRLDVVHFHHLSTVSTGLVAEASRRGLPVAFTLHDYWLICHRGQFVKNDLSLCPEQADSACARCVSSQVRLNASSRVVRNVANSLLEVLPAGTGARVKRRLRRWYGSTELHSRSAGRAAEATIHARMTQVRDLCSRVDLFLAPSEALRRRFIAFGIPEERIERLGYGFDAGLASLRPRQPDGHVRFGYLGSWIPTKGLHVLVDAFNQLPPDRATLHIYGAPGEFEGWEDYSQKLRRRARSGRVRFEGAFDHRDLPAVLASLDVVVLPSIWEENAPLCVQEAILAGRPVIASAVGGVPDLVAEGVDGFLVPPRDPEALRIAMARFLSEERPSEGLRPRRAAMMDLRTCAAEHLRVYERIRGSRSVAAVARPAPAS
jgi:glycosyltransferase involved in cell wall biosynthesis